MANPCCSAHDTQFREVLGREKTRVERLTTLPVWRENMSLSSKRGWRLLARMADGCLKRSLRPTERQSAVKPSLSSSQAAQLSRFIFLEEVGCCYLLSFSKEVNPLKTMLSCIHLIFTNVFLRAQFYRQTSLWKNNITKAKTPSNVQWDMTQGEQKGHTTTGSFLSLISYNSPQLLSHISRTKDFHIYNARVNSLEEF